MGMLLTVLIYALIFALIFWSVDKVPMEGNLKVIITVGFAILLVILLVAILFGHPLTPTVKV